MSKLIFIFIILACLLVMIGGRKTIINLLAFYPDRQDLIPVENLPEGVSEIVIDTTDHIKIQGYLIPDKSSDRLLIYFHGNAGNIGHRLDDLIQLNRFGINVLGVGYRGYGKSQGKPSETGIYKDGQSALDYATDTLGFKQEKITVFGRSIGTTVAVEITQNRNIDRLILVTPLTSGKDHAKATGLGLLAPLAGDAFNNLGKVAQVSCPVLVIHGSRDSIIPIEMGETIFNAIKSEKQFIKIEKADHNDLSTLYAIQYWPPIDAFINPKE